MICNAHKFLLLLSLVDGYVSVYVWVGNIIWIIELNVGSTHFRTISLFRIHIFTIHNIVVLVMSRLPLIPTHPTSLLVSRRRVSSQLQSVLTFVRQWLPWCPVLVNEHIILLFVLQLLLLEMFSSFLSCVFRFQVHHDFSVNIFVSVHLPRSKWILLRLPSMTIFFGSWYHDESNEENNASIRHTLHHWIMATIKTDRQSLRENSSVVQSLEHVVIHDGLVLCCGHRSSTLVFCRTSRPHRFLAVVTPTTPP